GGNSGGPGGSSVGGSAGGRDPGCPAEQKLCGETCRPTTEMYGCASNSCEPCRSPPHATVAWGGDRQGSQLLLAQPYISVVGRHVSPHSFCSAGQPGSRPPADPPTLDPPGPPELPPKGGAPPELPEPAKPPIPESS